ALDYAHRQRSDDGRPLRIVHRDVSPHNILLAREGQVKVTDFGIARADEPGLGQGENPRVLRGKYAYMSPEQARGEALDPRSDLFAFGVVLYELSCGRRLFEGRKAAETLELVRGARIPRVDAAALEIPGELARIIRRCLASAPDDRYPTAGGIYQDLSKLLVQLGEFPSEVDL